MQISKTKGDHDEALAKAVSSLVDAMRADYGERFTRVFVDASQLKRLKQRLYSRFVGAELIDIRFGYEQLAKTNPSFVPTVPEIAESVRQAKKRRISKPYVALTKPVLGTKPDFSALREAIGGRYEKNNN